MTTQPSTSSPFTLPSDPLFHLQWHLLNLGNTPGSVAGYDINVVGVWPDYTGQGVLVAVIDQGIEENHPDIVQNYRQDLSWDLVLNVPGAAIQSPEEAHGTLVTGLVAAANNDVGGVGVAWDADSGVSGANGPIGSRPWPAAVQSGCRKDDSGRRRCFSQ